MPDPDEPVAIRPESQNLAAPDGLVAAITGAVERHSDDGLTETTMLGQQRHHVGMMVLDEIQRALIGMPLGPITGLVSRVQVRGQSHWLLPDLAELGDRTLERLQRLQRFHVADVSG